MSDNNRTVTHWTPEFRNYIKSYVKLSSIRAEGEQVIATYVDGTTNVIGVTGDFPLVIESNDGWTAQDSQGDGNIVINMSASANT